ncbi:MAG: lipopolysaccharide biosynthesis protein, partial [Hyphomicrobium denitrificans]|nr:lipopolysaccharide biosynthesis protein [Hyphomicrobium denitrificans]
MLTAPGDYFNRWKLFDLSKVMQSRVHASPDDIDLGSVFGAFKRSLRWLIPLALLFGGLTYGVLSLIAPRYQSEAELAIIAKGADGTFADRNASGG